jgi:hypothetical protein
MNIDYLKPTPMGVELLLKAWVEGPLARKSRVLCEIWAGDVMTVRADTLKGGAQTLHRCIVMLSLSHVSAIAARPIDAVMSLGFTRDLTIGTIKCNA